MKWLSVSTIQNPEYLIIKLLSGESIICRQITNDTFHVKTGNSAPATRKSQHANMRRDSAPAV